MRILRNALNERNATELPIDAHTRVLDNLAPHKHVGFHRGGKFRRRTPNHIDACLEKSFPDFRLGKKLDDFLVEQVDDGLRRFGRRPNPGNRASIVTGHCRGYRRQSRRERGLAGRCNRQRSEATRLAMKHKQAIDDKHKIMRNTNLKPPGILQ